MAAVRVLGRPELEVTYEPQDSEGLAKAQEAVTTYSERGFLVMGRKADSDVMEKVTTITPEVEEVTIVPRIAGGER